jgi:hypothetical protein
VATDWVPVGTKIMKKLSAIFTAAFVIPVLFFAGCKRTEQDGVAEQPPAVMPSPAASPAPEWMAAGATNRVADILSDPNAFLGKTVTVVSDVEDVYGPRAFTLDVEYEDSYGAKNSEEDLLTLIPKVGGFPSVDAQWKDRKARVTGVVQRMEQSIEREIGWVLPQRLKSEYRGKPVLIVRSIERLAR